MKFKCADYYILVFFLITLIIQQSEGARRGGGGGRGGKIGGRWCIPKIPVQHQQRNSTDHYYEHKDRAQIVKSSHFELDYMLGRKITFFCMAIGLPRPEITWFKDGIELYYHKFFQVHETRLGNDTIKSKMEIDPANQKDAGYYECQADNQYAIDFRVFRTDYVMFSY